MKKVSKTKAQLVEELALLRRQVTELEVLKNEHEQTVGTSQAEEESKERSDYPKAPVRKRVAGLKTANKQLQREVAERQRAEQAIRKSEERYGTILEEMNDGYFEVDLQGNFTFGNKTAVRNLGYSLEELIGKNYEAVTLAEDMSKVFEAYNSVYRTGQPARNFRYRVVRQDGSLSFFETSAFPLRNDKGEIIGFRGISRDITDRKLVEEALRTLEEQHRIFVELTSDYVYVFRVDPTGQPVLEWISEAFERMTGYTVEEFRAQPSPFENIHPDDRLATVENHRRVMEGETTVIETRIIVKHGEVRWVRNYARPIWDNSHSRVVAIYGAAQDITERKKAEEAVRRNERVLNLFVEHSPAAIAMFDRDMKYIVASRRYLVDYNLGEQNLIGRSHYEVFPEMPDRWKEIHRRCLAGAIEKADEDPFQRKDGRLDWVRWEIQPWYEKEGEIGGTILFSEVITERKEAEQELTKYREHLEELVKERTAELEAKTEELQQANIRLQEVDRLKSVFLASMSHELRTPLNSIIGFTGIILQGMSGEISWEQRKQLTMVKNSANHLLSLINDVLDISKIEAGRVELSLEEFRLNDVVSEVADDFSIAVSEKGLELIVEVPENVVLFSDKRRVKQVLMNLVSNAVKFTERGAVKIAARVLDGEKLELCVSDTGIGIKEEDMSRLFEPFQQVDMSLRKRHEGTGLGLYLTRKLADLLGGDVSAKSRDIKGSEFTFTIPLRKA